MSTSVPAPPAKKSKPLPMAVCQVCSGGKAPKGGGTVVCLTCAAGEVPAAA